ncbi:hypothetical protein SAMN02745163_00897 [Clostridium cavendishii DSM 21758]|uniref:Methyltransferase domain-containing protein n=1 Tax=Clostridium cavendishii DSM 21758 TaxID=1121302 RepID=A0A1M6EN97_9CLOT|nr:hypothetical protein SAMN02745163_00897 [Clostridium cavendishii DSM 21758]
MNNIQKMEGDKMRATKIDMRNVNFKGNVLDIGSENYGVIYNLIKEDECEISVDYLINDISKESEHYMMYETAVIFFSLSKLWNNFERKKLLFETWQTLKKGGELHIWDYEKNTKEIINENITVTLKNDKIKKFNYSNKNPFCEFSLETSKKILEKYYEIEETSLCSGIIYLKAKRKGILKDESIANSHKFKIHSQQPSIEVFKGIYQGIKLSGRNKGIFNK